MLRNALQDVSTSASLWHALLSVAVIQAIILDLTFKIVLVLRCTLSSFEFLIYGKLNFLPLDVNECKLFSNCDVNAKCINTAGSYKCLCKEGFQGSGSICTGVSMK